MNIELISIGDELLKGMIVNTNVAFISRHLQQNGYTVRRQTTLPDQQTPLMDGFKHALERADLVIATGGLGPTLDDRTRHIAAELFHSDFHFDEQIAAELKYRYPDMPVSIEDQATLPKKACPLPNRLGTAPGLVFEEKGKTLILLPGVPREMEPMFVEDVLPLIQKRWPLKTKKAIDRLFFCLLYESHLDTPLRELSKRYPSVDIGIYPSHGMLSIALQADDPAELALFKKELVGQFENYHYLAPSGKIEEALHMWFVKHHKKLAFAESCTGGMLSTAVTALPGASDYFLGSFVAYSNALKEQVLAVSKETLLTKGAVSEETVREMLEGVFKRTGADFGIAVSGIAGPTGGTQEKPVGTICAAIGQRGKDPDVGTFKAIGGNRQMVILSTTNRLLSALWRKVEKGISAFPF